MNSNTLDDSDELLTTDEVAKLTKFAKATLITWRSRGTNGPPYHKLGHAVRYKKSEVLEWLKLIQVTPAYMRLGDSVQATQPRPWMQSHS